MRRQLKFYVSVNVPSAGICQLEVFYDDFDEVIDFFLSGVQGIIDISNPEELSDYGGKAGYCFIFCREMFDGKVCIDEAVSAFSGKIMDLGEVVEFCKAHKIVNEKGKKTAKKLGWNKSMVYEVFRTYTKSRIKRALSAELKRVLGPRNLAKEIVR